MSKPFKCRGSFRTGSACANQDLPEGVTCARCTEAEFTPEKKKVAVEAEVERTKDLPASRVKPKQ